MSRLPTKLWIDALIRRAHLAGAFAAVTQRGDEQRGDVLVKVFVQRDAAKAFASTFSVEGERRFIDLAAEGVGPSEADVDQAIARRVTYDMDLWVVEIEDREGRHFLTEPVETSR